MIVTGRGFREVSRSGGRVAAGPGGIEGRRIAEKQRQLSGP